MNLINQITNAIKTGNMMQIKHLHNEEDV